MISLAEAKLIAQKELVAEVIWDMVHSPYLSDFYIEKKNCWIFFAHESTALAPDGLLACTAYAVSKLGEVRGVYDLREDVAAMKAFAEKISVFFEPA